MLMQIAITEVIPRLLSDGLICIGDIKGIVNPNVISMSTFTRNFNKITDKVDTILFDAVNKPGCSSKPELLTGLAEELPITPIHLVYNGIVTN